MGIRNYANAPATVLSTGCTTTSTVIHAAADPGFPTTPFTLILSEGQATEEVVLCTAKVNGDFTVIRGWDQTTAYAHSQGQSLSHGISAIDPREANTHVNATHDVHGVNGTIVGTTMSQTLTNKTLTSPTVNDAAQNRPVIKSGVIKADTVVKADLAGSPVPLEVQDYSGVRQGYVDTDGTLHMNQIKLGESTNGAGLISYVWQGQATSGVVVRDSADNALAGFDADGNVYAYNLAPWGGGGAPNRQGTTIPPYAYYRKTDADHLPAGTWQTLHNFSLDSNKAIWHYVSGVWTIPFDGRYRITVCCGFDSGSAQGGRGIRVMVNTGSGDVEQARTMVPAGSTVGASLNLTFSKPLISGYKVSLQAYQSSGGSLAAGGSTNGPCLMQIEWLGLTA